MDVADNTFFELGNPQSSVRTPRVLFPSFASRVADTFRSPTNANYLKHELTCSITGGSGCAGVQDRQELIEAALAGFDKAVYDYVSPGGPGANAIVFDPTTGLLSCRTGLWDAVRRLNRMFLASRLQGVIRGADDSAFMDQAVDRLLRPPGLECLNDPHLATSTCEECGVTTPGDHFKDPSRRINTDGIPPTWRPPMLHDGELDTPDLVCFGGITWQRKKDGSLASRPYRYTETPRWMLQTGHHNYTEMEEQIGVAEAAPKKTSTAGDLVSEMTNKVYGWDMSKAIPLGQKMPVMQHCPRSSSRVI